MPPAAKRDCGLILFDVNSNKKEQLLTGLIKFATLKWFSMSKDVYRLVLSNSKITRNERKYPNLYTTNIEDFAPHSILESIENAEYEEGDWLDALLLSLYHLREEEVATLSGLVTLQIVFFTCLDSSSKTTIDEKKLETIIKKLNKQKIYLYIIGPDVKTPCIITDSKDISQCMKGLIVDTSNKSLVAARRIVQSVDNAVMCDVKLGINLLDSFRNHRESQPWKIPLTFGTLLEIPSITVKIYKKELPLKLTSDKVRVFQRVLAEDQTVEVSYDDIVKGVLRHEKFIKIDDGDMFRMDTTRCFQVVGFTDKKFVPETYMRDETFYVLPNHELFDDSIQAFYNLVKVLSNQNKYGILKKVYMKNCKPKYFVLIPRPDMRPPCFVMVGLPYTDDLKWRHKCESPVPPLSPQLNVASSEDDELFTRFFNSIDVSSKANTKTDVFLSPTMMLDPYINKMVNCAGEKLLKRHFDFKSVELDDVHQSMIETTDFRNSWPVSLIE